MLKLKSKNLARFITIATVSFMCFGCSFTKAEDNAQNNNKKNIEVSETLNKAEIIDDKVEKILSTMKTSEKIGQMVMIGLYGEDVNDDSKFLLHQYHIGGIIFFERNMKNPEQVKKFIANLKAAGDKKAPMLFALDEEGGIVVRMKESLTPPPSAASLGATNDPARAYTAMRPTADEMHDMGFNVDFAPVVDLNLDRGRSYSSDSNTVTNFAGEALQAINDAKLIGTLKHFPGLGGAVVDTHKGTAVVNKTKAELLQNDLIPYINMNKNYNYFIMVGHGTYPALDNSPASISKPIVTDLLRNELKYDGVVVTDDLNMGAINMYTPEERALKAIDAGCDIILSCHEYDITTKMYLALLDAAETGKLKEERINQSVRRILKAKLLLESNNK